MQSSAACRLVTYIGCKKIMAHPERLRWSNGLITMTPLDLPSIRFAILIDSEAGHCYELSLQRELYLGPYKG
jgi:hypothetical protein